jgi:phage FluMu protein Com
MLFKKKIKCPYCDEVLEKRPSRKTKCPFCKNYIYVRGQKLVIEEEANIIDSLKTFNFTRDQYLKSEKALTKKFGFKPKYNDVIWTICNEEIIKNINDYGFLSSLYYQMALFLNKRGRNFFHILQQAGKAQLENMKTMDIKEVEILSVGGCPSCEELNGKKFTIEDALDKMPIPNKHCSNKNYNNFCRCIYQPIIRRG